MAKPRTSKGTTVNGSSDGGVHFRIDPDTGQMVFWQGDKTAIFDAKGKKVGAASPGAAPTGVNAEALSEVDGRLARLMAGYNQPEIKKVQIHGEDWFIKRIDFEDLTLIGLLQPRNKRNRLVITKKGNMRGLLAAMLFVCCVTSETDDTPYFPSWVMAYYFAAHKAPSVVATNNDLFAAINELNPEIIPTDSVEVEQVEEPEDEEDPT